MTKLKLQLYLKQGESTYVFQKGAISFPENSTLRVSNIKAYWRFDNILEDASIQLTDSGSSQTGRKRVLDVLGLEGKIRRRGNRAYCFALQWKMQNYYLG